jgi:hypothetical protein
MPSRSILRCFLTRRLLRVAVRDDVRSGSIPAVAAAGPLPPCWIVFGAGEPGAQRPTNRIIICSSVPLSADIRTSGDIG